MTKAATQVPFIPGIRGEKGATAEVEPPAGTAKEANFNLERLYVALARKLYDEGF